MSKIVRKVIATAKAPGAIGPYSQAVQVNHTLYISGQIGMNPSTMNLLDGVEAQTKQALTSIGHILDAAGSGFNKVVKCTVLLADMADFGKVNEIYATFFTAPYPARAAYQVANLPKGAKVEIETIAIVGDVQSG